MPPITATNHSDSLRLALTTTQMQSFLATLEQGAAEYGMSPNSTKTELLVRDPEAISNLNFRYGYAYKIPRPYDRMGTTLRHFF